jgi:hypothetical protein
MFMDMFNDFIWDLFGISWDFTKKNKDFMGFSPRTIDPQNRD